MTNNPNNKTPKLQALGRAAMLKFEEDNSASLAEKLHELLTLIIASPVGERTR